MENLWHKVDKAASSIAGKVGIRDSYAQATNRVVSLLKSSENASRQYLEPGHLVQLQSRLTERTVQIVRRESDNEMIINCVGGSGTEWFNACWVVQQVSTKQARIRLHNSFNYLVLNEHGPAMEHVPSHLHPPLKTEWLVFECMDSRKYVVLESAKYPCHYLCFDRQGTPMKGTDKAYAGAHFAVNVVSKFPPVMVAIPLPQSEEAPKTVPDKKEEKKKHKK